VKPGYRDRIAEALQDETRSYRSLAVELGVSDWLVRKVARELDGDPRPMKLRPLRSHETPEDVSAVTSWLVFGGFVVCLALAIWAGVRWAPPLDPRDFSTGFHSDSSTERKDDETNYD
jgi:hypothetical protein